jgi:glycine hydroxymethyltransferase
LERAGLIVNKNTVPGEIGTAVNPSGIRLGSPAATTFGFGPDEFREIGRMVAAVSRDVADEALIERTAARVTELCASVEARRSAQSGEGAPRVAALA